MTTIKTGLNGWKLNKYSELEYFKNGKANMHVAISYCIENDNFADGENRVATGIFWIQTAKEANQIWARFKKTEFNIGFITGQLESEAL